MTKPWCAHAARQLTHREENTAQPRDAFTILLPPVQQGLRQAPKGMQRKRWNVCKPGEAQAHALGGHMGGESLFSVAFQRR